jgi:DnaJ family protein B protein 4
LLYTIISKRVSHSPLHHFRQIFGGGGLGGLFGGMGGMGGMPSGMGGGMGGMGGGKRRNMFDMDVDDDDMGGGSSFNFGGMPGGMPGAHSRAPPQRSQTTPSSAPSEIVRPLKLPLNDLYSGTTKHIKVGRRLLDGTIENKVLDINISPGFKPGTKIRFPRAGNEQMSGEAQDLVFVVEEKPHDIFTRDGENLICNVKISLLEALAGSSSGGRLIKTVEHLDGRKLQIQVPPPVVHPGQTTTVSGEGMPVRKEGAVHRRGDLIVKWDVVFPDRLTASQQEGIKKVLG